MKFFPRKNLSLSLLLIMAACGSTPDSSIPSQPAHTTITPAPVVAPTLTQQASEAQAIVIRWQQLGLHAFAQYQEINRVYSWSLLQTTLPSNAKQAKEVAADAITFAKRANRPVQMILTTDNKKNSALLSQAIREAAAKSGGDNTVKFDRIIDSRLQSMLQLRIMESK